MAIRDLRYEPSTIKRELKKWMDSEKVKKRLLAAKPLRLLKEKAYKAHNGKVSLEDLQIYLEVYDMWKEKVQNRKPGDPGGWDEIMQHFQGWRTASNESDRRLYQSYKERAEKIIFNAVTYIPHFWMNDF